MKKETLKKFGTPIALFATIGALMITTTGCAHHRHHERHFSRPHIRSVRTQQVTAGTYLGNTVKGLTNYYREYRR